MNSRTGLILKTLIYMLLVPGVLLVYVPYLLRGGAGMPVWDLGWAVYFGWLAALAGLGAALWSMGAFIFKGDGTFNPLDPPKEFVAVGLYRFTRNPMYVGSLLLVLGEFLIYGALAVLVWLIFLFVAFHLFVMYYEEPNLAKTFGNPYEEYRQQVPRWWRITRK